MRTVPMWIAGCVVAAAVSMTVAPTALNFDPWAWLVWGREVGHLELDTTGGPSWKPLPVVITALLSVAGDAAPMAWMFLVRAGGLLGLAVTGAVAADVVRAGSNRRSAPAVAAVAAVVFLALSPDVKPQWVRTLAVGHSGALVGGCAMWALHAHLCGRRRTAWIALVAASLLRPEAWPFLVGYGAWLVRTRPTRRCRVGVTAGWAATAVLWFGGDAWGSGSPFHGADAARSGPSSATDRVTRIVEVGAGMVPAAVWVLAAVAVATAAVSWRSSARGGAERRLGRAERVVLGLTGLAAGWVAVVAGLVVVAGYAPLSRFLIAPAAAVCVVAAVGMVTVTERILSAAGGQARKADVAVGMALVAGLMLSASRLGGMADVWDETVERGDVTADLTAAFDDASYAVGGSEAMLACGQPSIEHRPLVRPQLAWLLDAPLGDVHIAREPVEPGVMFVVAGSTIDREQTTRPVDGWRELAVNERWRVLAIGCPALMDTRTGTAQSDLDEGGR